MTLAPQHRIELADFVAITGMTPDQVADEMASARLGFYSDDDGGGVCLSKFDVLDWIARRTAALGYFGPKRVGFNLCPAERSDVGLILESDAAAWTGSSEQ